MPELPPSLTLMAEIESRQDEVLRQLDELDARIQSVLAECTAFCQGATKQYAAAATLPFAPAATTPFAASSDKAASIPAVKVA